jgi:hypothetical protein
VHTMIVFVFLNHNKNTLMSLQILLRMISPWYVLRWLPLDFPRWGILSFEACVYEFIWAGLNLEIKINDKIIEVGLSIRLAWLNDFIARSLFLNLITFYFLVSNTKTQKLSIPPNKH